MEPEKQFQFHFCHSSVIMASVDLSDAEINLYLDLDVSDDGDPEYVIEKSGICNGNQSIVLK